jgi:hypothetical protein
MAREISLTDPVEAPPATGVLARAFLPLIEDERDWPFVRLALAMTVVLLPCALWLLLTPGFSWWLAIAYWALLYRVFFDRFILMLHATSHRRLFRRRHGWLNAWIPWLLGPLCGETPETYLAHHVAMHHVEENLAGDLSSTMRYQRDSLGDFLRYLADFLVTSMWKLGRYHWTRGRVGLTRALLAGEWSFYALVAAALWWNWQGALVVLVVPFVSARVLMMCGNWGQHAFVDAADPGNPYRMATTFINVRYNRRCFNDGYHVSHHVAPTRHWTDLPADFLANRERYARNDSAIFSGLDNFMCWGLLMLKDYDRLARHFVDLHDPPRPHDEVVALLRSRTRAIV